MRINKPTDKGVKNIVSILLLFAVTIGVFQYTVKIRKPWFGTLSPGHHQWLSGSTLKFSKNWYREGPLTLKFGAIENPESVEFPTLRSREPYPSYPPGAILPIYIISKLTGNEPTPSLLMIYNLLNHFLIAFFLSLTVFFFLLQLKFSYLNSFILSIVPMSLELLLPAPLYWHQNVFHADQAVILPFVLFIFLEVIRGNIKNGRISLIVGVFQGLVLFYGFLTEWLFVFVAATVYIKRISNGEIRRDMRSLMQASVRYWFPAILALCLFILQLYSLGISPQTMVDKLLFRTGLGAGGEKYVADFFDRFWNGHIANGYGTVAIRLLWGSLFFLVLSFSYIAVQRCRRRQTNERIKKISYLIGILLIPCFLQIYFLKAHSRIHDFSALKFSIPIATVPFVLLPILAFSLLKMDFTSFSLEGLKISYNNRKKEIRLSIIVLCIIVLAGVYLKNVHPRFGSFFPEPNRRYEEIGRFISANTEYKDVVFSPNFEIKRNPPQQLSYSMKRVYKVNRISDIYDKVNPINEDFEVNILSVGEEIGSRDYAMGGLISAAYDVRQANELYLYKIKKKDFDRFIKDSLNSDLPPPFS